MLMKKINLNDYVTYNPENGQSDVSMISTDMVLISELISKGWKSVQLPYGYYLRAPSAWIVDMTDPFKILSFYSIYENLAYFLFLRNLCRKNKIYSFINDVINQNKHFYKDFQYTWVSGPIVESEYRIIGLDNRVKKLKENLYAAFFHCPQHNYYINLAENYLGETKHFSLANNPLCLQACNVQNYFHMLQNIFFNVGVKVYNEKTITIDFQKLPTFDKILLSPTGCFDFLSTLLVSFNEDFKKYAFYEVHSDPHKIGNSQYNCNMQFGDVVLAIDKIYSGRSVQLLAKCIKHYGATPIKIGLFPKSKAGIKMCNYVVIGNKLISSQEVDKYEDWVCSLYRRAYSITLD